MPVDNIQGPQSPVISETLDLPKCVVITSEQDEKDFRDFVAKIIIAARTAWEKEKR
jgi:hypothetical protein